MSLKMVSVSLHPIAAIVLDAPKRTPERLTGCTHLRPHGQLQFCLWSSLQASAFPLRELWWRLRNPSAGIPELMVSVYSPVASKQWMCLPALNCFSPKTNQFGWKGTSFSQIATLTTVPLGLTDSAADLMLAGTPAQSRATFGPWPLQISLHFLTTSSFVGSMIWVAPKCSAYSCLCFATSATMMMSAPRALRHWTTPRPMGPAPRTSALSPFWMSYWSTACQATARGSTSAPISRGIDSGSLKTNWLSMQTASLMPPPPPLSPTKPAESHELMWPPSHGPHDQQQIVGSTATLSPTLSPCLFSAEEPISSTVPLNSWPTPTGISSRVTGCGFPGWGTKVGVEYSCRSVPQMPINAGFTLICAGPHFGSGTSLSTRRSLIPWYRRARMTSRVWC